MKISYESIMRFVTFQVEPHRDPYEPVFEPAKSLYRALKAETKNREGRPLNMWIAAERNAIFNEAVRQAKQRKITAPTMETVMKAERLAMGHIDYLTKWSLMVAEIMTASVITHSS